jgi:hypothetical protein
VWAAVVDRLPEDRRLQFVSRDQRPRTPRLARRVGLFGGLVVALFAILLFRLWSL